jgi:segregation and condensation protein A
MALDAGSLADPMPSEYKVKLEVFEGPLDLLLYLIKKDEVDVYDIVIERITQQYLEFMDAFKILDLEVAGEFVVMAANLIYIKSRSLLPRTYSRRRRRRRKRSPLGTGAPAGRVQEIQRRRCSPRAAGGGAGESLHAPPRSAELVAERPLGEVSVFDLINAFNGILKRLNQKEDLREIFEKTSPSRTKST